MLSIRDRMSIDLADRHYKHEGAREAAMVDLLGYTSPARFWLRVNWLLEQGAAEAELPMKVRRLARLRAARRGVRVR